MIIDCVCVCVCTLARGESVCLCEHVHLLCGCAASSSGSVYWVGLMYGDSCSAPLSAAFNWMEQMAVAASVPPHSLLCACVCVCVCASVCVCVWGGYVWKFVFLCKMRNFIAKNQSCRTHFTVDCSVLEENANHLKFEVLTKTLVKILSKTLFCLRFLCWIAFSALASFDNKGFVCILVCGQCACSVTMWLQVSLPCFMCCVSAICGCMQTSSWEKAS